MTMETRAARASACCVLALLAGASGAAAQTFYMTGMEHSPTSATGTS